METPEIFKKDSEIIVEAERVYRVIYMDRDGNQATAVFPESYLPCIDEIVEVDYLGRMAAGLIVLDEGFFDDDGGGDDDDGQPLPKPPLINVI